MYLQAECLVSLLAWTKTKTVAFLKAFLFYIFNILLMQTPKYYTQIASIKFSVPSGACEYDLDPFLRSQQILKIESCIILMCLDATESSDNLLFVVQNKLSLPVCNFAMKSE